MNRATTSRTSVLLALATTALVASCASPRTSDGILDNGLPEAVVELDRPEDRKAVLLHLEKIRVGREALKLAERRDAQLRQLVEAGRASAADMLVGTIGITRARVHVLDAQLAFARSGLLSPTKPTMIDTDEDGLPDLRHSPLRVADLLREKVETLETQYGALRTGHARVEALANAGRASTADLRASELRMRRAQKAWRDAQDELRVHTK